MSGEHVLWVVPSKGWEMTGVGGVGWIDGVGGYLLYTVMYCIWCEKNYWKNVFLLNLMIENKKGCVFMCFCCLCVFMWFCYVFLLFFMCVFMCVFCVFMCFYVFLCVFYVCFLFFYACMCDLPVTWNNRGVGQPLYFEYINFGSFNTFYITLVLLGCCFFGSLGTRRWVSRMSEHFFDTRVVWISWLDYSLIGCIDVFMKKYNQFSLRMSYFVTRVSFNTYNLWSATKDNGGK